MTRKASLYSFWDAEYPSIEDDLTLYIGPFDFSYDVHTFMLPHEKWDLFVINTSGMGDEREHNSLRKLGEVVKQYPDRIVAVWSHHTWRTLSREFTHIALRDNCILCDGPDWIRNLESALRMQRRLRNEKR